MKLILKTLDEAAKWRKTSFKTKLNDEEIVAFEQKYGIDNLYIHFDSGVAKSSRGFGYEEPLAIRGGTQDKDWSKDPDQNDPTLSDVGSTERVPQKSFNPQTRFSTPVGIYIYPLRYAREVIGVKDFASPEEIRKFPFANEASFLYIYYIPSENILQLNDLWKTDLFPKALTRAVTATKSEWPLYHTVERALSDSDFFKYTKWKIKNSEFISANMNGKSIWELFRDNFNPQSTTETAEAAFARCWFFFTNNISKRNINKWSKLLVDLGVRAINDYGNGIIHPSEPYQGVIIDTAAAKLLLAKENPNNSNAYAIAAADDQDAYDDEIQEKYEGYAQFSANQAILNKIFGYKLPALDRALTLNKNASRKMLFALFSRPYAVSNLAKNLIANPTINRDEVKAQYIKLMDLYGTDEGARKAQKYEANEIIYTAINSNLIQEPDFRARLLSYFITDPGTIQNILGATKVTEEELKKILISMPPGSQTGDLMTRKGRLFYDMVWGKRIEPSAEWVSWLWNLNDPELDREKSIIQMVEFYDMTPSRKPDINFAKTFKQTVYANPQNKERAEAAWEYLTRIFPELGAKIAAERLSRNKGLKEAHIREAVKRKTLLGRRF
jgi:hypothetical protein